MAGHVASTTGRARAGGDIFGEGDTSAWLEGGSHERGSRYSSRWVESGRLVPEPHLALSGRQV